MNDFNGTTGPSWKAGIVAWCLAACSPSAADSEVNGSAQSGGSGADALGGSHEISRSRRRPHRVRQWIPARSTSNTHRLVR